MWKNLFGLVLFIVLIPGSARAAMVFADAFDTNGALLGTTPQIGGLWTITGTSTLNPLTIASNQLVVQTTGQDAYTALSTPVNIASTMSLLTSFTLNVTSAQATGDYFLHLSDPLGTTSQFYSRIYAQSSGTGFLLGLQSNSGTGTVITYGTEVLSFGTPYQIVSTWNFIPGALNDSLALSVNGNPYIASYTWTGNAEPASNVSAINIRQGTGTSAPVLLIDNLQVDTAVIPEPTSLVLLSAVVMSLSRRRRLQATE